MKEIGHYDRCFYCNHCWNNIECIMRRDLLTCEVWSPDKDKIVQYAAVLNLSVTDLISLINLRGVE